MNYKLLATDMDGTLLGSDKQISKKNQDAINEALEAGKIVLFSSGRCIDELKEFFPMFPKMRYVLCESGAGIYDLEEEKFLYRKTLDPSCVEEILRYVHEKDVMIQVLTQNHSVLSREDYENLDHYYMAGYHGHFTRTALITDSSYEYCKDIGWRAEKLCLYHENPEERLVTKERFESLPLCLAYSETTSLEVSPQGVDKGIAITRLCEQLGITTEEVMAIGDGFNDMSILKTVGLPVAMGNAVPEIKEICAHVVADCDHDGVAEAIYKYLCNM